MVYLTKMSQHILVISDKRSSFEVLLSSHAKTHGAEEAA